MVPSSIPKVSRGFGRPGILPQSLSGHSSPAAPLHLALNGPDTPSGPLLSLAQRRSRHNQPARFVDDFRGIGTRTLHPRTARADNASAWSCPRVVQLRSQMMRRTKKRRMTRPCRPSHADTRPVPIRHHRELSRISVRIRRSRPGNRTRPVYPRTRAAQRPRRREAAIGMGACRSSARGASDSYKPP